LVKEAAETMREKYDDSVMDAALIGAAQRVEHYEIAGYGTVREFAQLLGEDEHVPLLEQTLEEEKQTDEKLTQLAQDINSEAESTDTESESEEEESGTRGSKKPGKGSSRRAA
jgi:ferritin-like metal-binding protein YciE